MKADERKDVSAIVERNDAQALFDWERNAGFGVDEKKFIASLGNGGLGAVGWRLIRAADPDIALRAGAIQRESPEGVGTAGEESLAGRNAAACIRLSQSDTNAVGPHDVMEFLFVKGGLCGELCKIDTGSEPCGVVIELEGTEYTLMLVEGIIARVASKVCSKPREANVLIFSRHEIRNFNAGQVGFAEAVANKEEILPSAIDKSLELIGGRLLLR